MIRIKRGNIANVRRKKILKLAKGFFAAHSRLFRIAHSKILKAFKNSFIGRKQKKRFFRRLWIIRLNAALKAYKVLKNYSFLFFYLKKQNIFLNRKILSQLTIIDPRTFTKLLTTLIEQ
uniref:50S ribosomal protein L20 n=1 Tax=Pteridomonas sp. YPF1301 TaxID=2766739 RepID=A0A7G1MU06_9STRA|nr:ribosomal protein L20 [Pteridomonas sp. YPF1301]